MADRERWQVYQVGACPPTPTLHGPLGWITISGFLFLMHHIDNFFVVMAYVTVGYVGQRRKQKNKKKNKKRIRKIRKKYE